MCKVVLSMTVAFNGFPYNDTTNHTTNAVRESQTDNQFGTPPLGAFFNQMKASWNMMLWKERDRNNVFK